MINEQDIKLRSKFSQFFNIAAVTLVTPACIVNMVKKVKDVNKYNAHLPIFLYPSKTVSFFTTVYLVENSKKGT